MIKTFQSEYMANVSFDFIANMSRIQCRPTLFRKLLYKYFK